MTWGFGSGAIRSACPAPGLPCMLTKTQVRHTCFTLLGEAHRLPCEELELNDAACDDAMTGTSSAAVGCSVAATTIHQAGPLPRRRLTLHAPAGIAFRLTCFPATAAGERSGGGLPGWTCKLRLAHEKHQRRQQRRQQRQLAAAPPSVVEEVRDALAGAGHTEKRRRRPRRASWRSAAAGGHTAASTLPPLTWKQHGGGLLSEGTAQALSEAFSSGQLALASAGVLRAWCGSSGDDGASATAAPLPDVLLLGPAGVPRMLSTLTAVVEQVGQNTHMHTSTD